MLGTPPAFILSQDQTLMFNLLTHNRSEDRSGYLLFVWSTLSFNKADSKASILSIRLSKTLGMNSTTHLMARCQFLQPEPLGPRRPSVSPQPQSQRKIRLPFPEKNASGNLSRRDQATVFATAQVPTALAAVCFGILGSEKSTPIQESQIWVTHQGLRAT